MAALLAITRLLHTNLKHSKRNAKQTFKLSIAQLLCYIQVHYELPKLKMMQEMSFVMLGF
jgi:hypothetical protein